ncbi:MAG: PHP domain-containing protein [Candidatus Dormibacteraceae bacterium]
MLRIDLHLHSSYSPDSRTSLGELIAACRELRLDRIALTDHNTVDGAVRLRSLAPELTIIGEEIRTTEGEIIGLFMTAAVPTGATPEEACDLIHQMGGLTYAAHPFDRRRAHFEAGRMRDLASVIDIVETYNPWCTPEANQAAQAFCIECGKVGASGSDAHGVAELGLSWMELAAFSSPEEFLFNLARAKHVITDRSGVRLRAPGGRAS